MEEFIFTTSDHRNDWKRYLLPCILLHKTVPLISKIHGQSSGGTTKNYPPNEVSSL